MRIAHYKPDGTVEDIQTGRVQQWIRDNQAVSEQELREARKALKERERQTSGIDSKQG